MKSAQTGKSVLGLLSAIWCGTIVELWARPQATCATSDYTELKIPHNENCHSDHISLSITMNNVCDMWNICKVTMQKAPSRANCKSLDQTDHISWQNKSLSIRFYVHLCASQKTYLYSQNTNLCFYFFVSNTLQWINLAQS